MDLKWTWTGEPATLEEVKSCVGEGWHSLIEDMIEDLTALGWSGEITQVKEKFGGLRFYYESDGIPVNFSRIALAVELYYEGLSFNRCYECGQNGHVRGPGWIITLCKKHAIEQGKDLMGWEK